MYGIRCHLSIQRYSYLLSQKSQCWSQCSHSAGSALLRFEDLGILFKTHTLLGPVSNKALKQVSVCKYQLYPGLPPGLFCVILPSFLWSKGLKRSSALIWIILKWRLETGLFKLLKGICKITSFGLLKFFWWSCKCSCFRDLYYRFWVNFLLICVAYLLFL